jgi:hypothetical protein
MITIQRKGNAYGVKHFVVDDKSDLELLRKDLLFMGSTAYVIASGEKYIVNGYKQWILMPKTGNSSGGDDNPDDDQDITHVIYDGGEVVG